MIRRGFWLAAGAVTGIYGYRRVTAAARRLSAAFTPEASLTPQVSLTPEAGRRPAAGRRPEATLTGRHARRAALVLARETYRFARDVREGMELYRLAHPAPAVIPGGDGPARPSRRGISGGDGPARPSRRGTSSGEDAPRPRGEDRALRRSDRDPRQPTDPEDGH